MNDIKDKAILNSSQESKTISLKKYDFSFKKYVFCQKIKVTTNIEISSNGVLGFFKLTSLPVFRFVLQKMYFFLLCLKHM